VRLGREAGTANKRSTHINSLKETAMRNALALVVAFLYLAMSALPSFAITVTTTDERGNKVRITYNGTKFPAKVCKDTNLYNPMTKKKGRKFCVTFKKN
jgi:hypothetical protein